MSDLARFLQQMSPAATSVERPSKTYGPFGEPYDIDYVTPPDPSILLGARFGFRGMPAGAITKGPWTPPEPRPQMPAREWKQTGDDSIGQHVYEALLGRVREPSDAVAKQGSGGNWLPWLIGAAAGYGGWRWADNRLGAGDAFRELLKNDAEERRAAVEAYYDLPHNKYNLHGSTRLFGTGEPMFGPGYVPYKP